MKIKHKQKPQFLTRFALAYFFYKRRKRFDKMERLKAYFFHYHANLSFEDVKKKWRYVTNDESLICIQAVAETLFDSLINSPPQIKSTFSIHGNS